MDKHEQRVREIIPDYRANAEQRRAEIVQALREAEAEALERAAKVADKVRGDAAKLIAASIRKLKDT